MSRCMAISLDASREPATLLPRWSTTTRSSGSINPLLITVGVQRRWPFSRRTDRLPSVAATRPVWCSNLPKRIISSRYFCSVTILWIRWAAISHLSYGNPVLDFRESQSRCFPDFHVRHNRVVLVSEFDYHFPDELIA